MEAAIAGLTASERRQGALLGLMVVSLFMFGGSVLDALVLPGPAGQLKGAACADSDVQCSGWAQQGDCESNPDYMSAACPVSCLKCVGAREQPVAAAAAPVAAAAAPGCADSDQAQCPAWAANGDCAKNSKWMATNCCVSCSAGVAAPVAPTASPVAAAAVPVAAAAAPGCADSDQAQCPAWAANGDCAKNSEWMVTNCCVSCAAGAAATPPSATAAADAPAFSEDCADSSPECPAWKVAGECEKNPDYTKANCRFSCSVCLKPPSKQSAAAAVPAAAAAAKTPCVDSDPAQCPAWATSGDCKKNSEWMATNCCKSCTAAVPCVDSDPAQCPAWAMQGDCTKNTAWMTENCR